MWVLSNDQKRGTVGDEQSTATDIRITLRDVYAIQLKQTETLAAVSASLQSINEKIDGSKEVQTDHENRLRRIESRLYSLPAAATLIALGSLVVAWKK